MRIALAGAVAVALAVAGCPSSARIPCNVNGHDLVLTTPAQLVAGIDADALALDAAQHGVASSLSVSALGSSSFSVVTCVEATSNIGDFDLPFYFGGASNGDPGVDLECGAG